MISAIYDVAHGAGIAVVFPVLPELSVPGDRINEMAEKCTASDTHKIGSFKRLGRDDVKAIYRLAL